MCSSLKEKLDVEIDEWYSYMRLMSRHIEPTPEVDPEQDTSVSVANLIPIETAQELATALTDIPSLCGMCVNRILPKEYKYLGNSYDQDELREHQESTIEDFRSLPSLDLVIPVNIHSVPENEQCLRAITGYNSSYVIPTHIDEGIGTKRYRP